MEKYNPDRVCPKCGYGSIYAGDESAITEWVKGLGLPSQEYILRRCSRCGYEWREKPLDAEEE